MDPAEAAAAAATPPAAEPAAAAPPAETPAVTPPVETPAPGPAPWAADLAARFEDEAVRSQVDAYLRETQQPRMTKLEQEAAELRGKAWVFDGLNSEDPLDTLTDIVGQVYGEDVATRIVELLDAGETPDDAAAIAAAEQESGEAPAATSLDSLPPEVKAAVEFARAEQARRAAEAEQKVEADALAEATTLYDSWRGDLLKKQPDIKENVLHAFVFAADGDMEQGLANYRAEFPAPAAPAPVVPPTLGGSTAGISNSRRTTSLGDAFGEVFDAAHGGTVTI